MDTGYPVLDRMGKSFDLYRVSVCGSGVSVAYQFVAHARMEIDGTGVKDRERAKHTPPQPLPILSDFPLPLWFSDRECLSSSALLSLSLSLSLSRSSPLSPSLLLLLYPLYHQHSLTHSVKGGDSPLAAVAQCEPHFSSSFHWCPLVFFLSLSLSLSVLN